MTTITMYGTTSNLYWYRHDGQVNGTQDWQPQKLVGNGGWQQFALVFSNGNDIIYGIDNYGQLWWYRHTGQANGTQDWAPRKTVSTQSWKDYTSVFASGEILYAIDRNGDLYWFRHRGQQDGTNSWDGPVLASRGGWDKVTAFPAGNNILYTVDRAGRIIWHKHGDVPDGTGSNWIINSREVSNWHWDDYVSVFAAPNNVIYAIDRIGRLYWWRHDGREDGSPTWSERKLVGLGGWCVFRQVFAAGDQNLYGVGIDTMSWMSAIPANLTVGQITIPGTHDTGTYTLSDTIMGVTNNAKCQTMNLQQQLDSGIRFIDIRLHQAVNNGTNDFLIYHSDTNTGLWFSTDILEVCKEFLRNHPFETIIMVLKYESGSDAQFAQNVEAYLDPKWFYLEPKIPTLAEARGRIVLVRRYSGSTAGIAADVGWPPDQQGSISLPPRDTSRIPAYDILNIQDVYGFGFSDEFNNHIFITQADKESKVDRKWSIVKNILDNARMLDDRASWMLNFLSASGPPTIINPVNFAHGYPPNKGMNERLCEYLQSQPYENFFTTIMDFPEYPNDGQVIRMLIKTNFKLTPS